jgi:hypothetical protein
VNCWNPTVCGNTTGISSQAPGETWEKVQRLPDWEVLVEGSMSPSKLYEKLTRHELRSAVIGMTLGDFNLQLHGVNVRAQTSHSPNVRDYVELKGTILRQIPGLGYSFKDVIQVNRKLGKSYPQIKIWTTTHPFLTKIRERMYRPEKQLNKGLLESLTPLGLALWFMDDGHLSLHHNVKRYSTDTDRSPSERSISSRPLIMNTHSFSEEENEVICSWLMSRWGIESQVKWSKGFFVYMNTENARRFVDIVRPYVLAVPSMHYKINFKYKNASSELLRFNIEYWTMEKGHERAASCVRQDGDIV